MKSIYRIALLVALSTLCAFDQGVSLCAAARARSRAGKRRQARPRRRRREAQAAATEISHGEVAYGRTGVTWSRFNEAIDDLTALARQKQWRKPRGRGRADDLRRRAHGDAIAILQWVYYRMSKLGFNALSREELSRMVQGLKLAIATAGRTKLRKPNPRLAQERLKLVRAALARAVREPMGERAPIQVPLTEPSLEPTPVPPETPALESTPAPPETPVGEDLRAQFAEIRANQVRWLDENPVTEASFLPLHREQISAFYEEINPFRELEKYNLLDLRLRAHRGAIQDEEARRTRAGGLCVTEPLPRIVTPPSPRPQPKLIPKAPLLQDQVARALAALIEHHVESIARAGDNLLDESEVRGFIESVQNFDQTNLSKNAIVALEGHHAYLGAYLGNILERVAFEQEALAVIDELIAGLRLNEALAAIVDHARYEAELKAASARLSQYTVDRRSSLAVRAAVRRGVQNIVARLAALRLEVARREREQRDAEQRARAYQLEKDKLEKLHRQQIAAFRSARLELQGHMNSFEAQTRNLEALARYEATFNTLVDNLRQAEIGDFVASGALNIQITNMQRRISNMRQDFLDAVRREAERNQAAIDIQRIGRGYLGRKRALRLQATRALDAIMEAYQGRLRDAQKEGFSLQIGVDTLEVLLAELNRLDTAHLDEQGQARLASFRKLVQGSVERFRQKIRLEKDAIEEQRRRAKEEEQERLRRQNLEYERAQERKRKQEEEQEEEHMRAQEDQRRRELFEEAQRRRKQREEEDKRRLELFKVAQRLRAQQEEQRHTRALQQIQAEQERLRKLQREGQRRKQEVAAQRLAVMIADHNQKIARAQALSKGRSEAIQTLIQGNIFEEDLGLLPQAMGFDRAELSQDDIRRLDAHRARLKELLERAKGRIREKHKRRREKAAATKIQALYRSFQVRKALRSEAEKRQFVQLAIDAARADPQAYPIEIYRSILQQGDARLVQYLKEDPSEELRALILKAHAAIQGALRDMQERVERARMRDAAAKIIQATPPSAVPELPVVDIDAILREDEERKRLAREEEAARIALLPDNLISLAQARDRDLFGKIKSFEDELAEKAIDDWSRQEHLMDMLLKRVKSHNASVKEARDEGKLTSHDVSGMLRQMEIFRGEDLDELAGHVLDAHISYLKKLRIDPPEQQPKETGVDAKDEEGFTQLHRAVERGSLEGVLDLIRAGAIVDARNRFDVTPLHMAAAHGHAAIAQELIDAGADVNTHDGFGLNALYYAITENNPQVVEVLIAAGADAKAKDANLVSGLHHAAALGNVAISQALIHAGADVNAQEYEDYFTPLHAAVIKGHPAVLQLLLDAGAEVDAKARDGSTPLHHAVARGDRAMIEALLRGGANINAQEYEDAAHLIPLSSSPLHKAARRGQVGILKLLIENGAEVNARAKDGSTALHYAAEDGNRDAIQILLDARAQVDARDIYDNTPLHKAAMSGGVFAVGVLLDTGAEVDATNRDGDTPLHMAAESGHAQIVSVLLAAGANESAEDRSRETPLKMAAYNGHDAVVRILFSLQPREGQEIFEGAVRDGNIQAVRSLIAAGAESNVRDSDGDTPLHWAAEDGYADVAAALIGAGAEVDARNEFHLIPLFRAVENRHAQIVRLLADAKADVNVQDEFHRTPLELAVNRGQAGVSAVLIGAGADVHGRDEEGRTLLYIAVVKGYPGVVRELIDAGVDVHGRDEQGRTLLHIAAEVGIVDSIEALVKAGVDILAKDAKGQTSIKYATGSAKNMLQRFMLRASEEKEKR